MYLFIQHIMVSCLHLCLYEGAIYPLASITGSFELPRKCCELNPGPLEEQRVFLTAEPLHLLCLMKVPSIICT